MAGNPIDNQTANTEAFIASREKANNKYGQPGFHGPASDLPGDKTRMDREFGLSADPSAAPGEWQTHAVSSAPAAPTAHGMKNPNASPARVPGRTDQIRTLARQSRARHR